MTDDFNAKMQKSLERIKKSVLQAEKSVEFSKGVLSECSDKFQDLDSQMEEISAVSKSKKASSFLKSVCHFRRLQFL